jgi:hypothetical protein
MTDRETIDRLRLELERIRGQIHDLEKKAGSHADKAHEDIRTLVSDLGRQEKDLEVEISKMVDASGPALGEMKIGVEGAIRELHEGLKRASARFRER